jgi:glutathione reductase (NADPH)
MVSKEDPSKETTKTMTGRHVLIATGGSAVKAPIPGAREFAITSDDALVLEDLPLPRGNNSPPRGPVVMVGAGYISLEFAGIFAGLGCDVRVLYRKDLPLACFDGECRAHVAECMRGRGVQMMAGTSPTR